MSVCDLVFTKIKTMGFQGYTPDQRFVRTNRILCVQNLCWRVSSFRAEMMIQKPSEKERQKSGKFAVLGGQNEKGS